MSELRVDSVKSKGGGAPNLPKGVTISGIATAATLGATQIDVSNVNVSGVVTSGTLSGDLLSTGTPTLGLGVTINSSGLVISGVATAGIVSATTIFGNGANLAGIGATIAPLFYNPDASDSSVSFGTGIGITFNQQIKAGTGNITIREGSSSGTVVENFGVGSSVTISENRVTFTPSSELSEGVVYHLSYPSGCFTNNEGTDYVGTAYTFKALGFDRQLWAWGYNYFGTLGINANTNAYRSSPVQVPGVLWNNSISTLWEHSIATKTDNTLWTWGENHFGGLGHNSRVSYSSPVQIPGAWSFVGGGYYFSIATKTDGTLWSWGYNTYGTLGQNSKTHYSSPVQIPGTTWAATQPFAGQYAACATKTDGTLWTWGTGGGGVLGQNSNTQYSSPRQVPGTTWGTDLKNKVAGGGEKTAWIKTDGTLWAWGNNPRGELGQNDRTQRSSPVQIPGTTWKSVGGNRNSMAATKTDGTLWTWGINQYGELGHNNLTQRSSPTQVPGTTWDICGGTGVHSMKATKTDGTLWTWGYNDEGELGQNDRALYSSPTQIPGTNWNLEGIATATQNDGYIMVRQVI